MSKNWRNTYGISSGSKSQETIDKLKKQLESSTNRKATINYNRFHTAISTSTTSIMSSPALNHRRMEQSSKRRDMNQDRGFESKRPIPNNPKIDKFLRESGTLDGLFSSSYKKTTTDEESKLYMNLSAEFTSHSMDTNNFSEEFDDSELILSKSKRFKGQFDDNSMNKQSISGLKANSQPMICDRCRRSQPKHLLIEMNSQNYTYMTLLSMKPFLGTPISDVLIRNNDHSCDSFVSSSYNHQYEVDQMVRILSERWKTQGYNNVILETHLRYRRSNYKNLVSCNDHFQVHCLPVPEKYFEMARMHFKQALLSDGQEWSLNKKLIKIDDGRKVQKHLPKGLSYIWVCFNNLERGFAHIIEEERDFLPNYGIEILCKLLLDKEKDKNATSLDFRKDSYENQLYRSAQSKCLLMDQKSEATIDEIPESISKV